MSNALVPEFAVSDWQKSKAFYCGILGFDCLYERPEEGFCYLRLGQAELMIDQIGQGRSFDGGHLPDSRRSCPTKWCSSALFAELSGRVGPV